MTSRVVFQFRFTKSDEVTLTITTAFYIFKDLID